MQSLISVIVPVYNTEKYLNKCVDSIINQTYKNLEIILVDDGSTDNSGRICDEYAKKDKRVVVIHKENGGLPDARNAGLDVASGEFIGFVDSDDWIDAKMYSILYDSLIENNCEIAMCARYVVSGNNRKSVFKTPEVVVMTVTETFKRLLTYDCMDSAVWDKLFKKDVIGDLRFTQYYYSEDVGFTYKAINQAKRIVHCGLEMYYYYQHGGSITKTGFSDKKMGIKINHKAVYDFVLDEYPELRKEAEYFYFSRLITLYRIMDRSGYRGSHRAIVNKDISANLADMLKNDVLSGKEKCIGVLIKLRVYPFVYMCVRAIKRIR